MAWIRATKTTETANAATYTVNLPEHQSGDLLLVWLTQDVGGTTITTSSSGWTVLAQERSGTAVRHAVAYKVAASSAEADPVFSGATDDWLGAAASLAEPGSNPFGASPADGTDYNSTAYTAATSYVAGALTTAEAGCLLIWSWGLDGSGSASAIGKHKINDARGLIRQGQNATLTQFVGYAQQQSAGAAATPTFYSSNNVAATGIVIAVRNASGGALQPDIRPQINEWYRYGNMSTHDTTPTWQAPTSFAATINGITCSSTAPTVATNGGFNLDAANYGSCNIIPSSESTAGAWVGSTHAVTSIDLTGKILAGIIGQNVASSSTLAGSDGWLLGLSDGTNWATYQIASKANGWGNSVPYAFAIAPGYATAYASSGSINLAAVTRIGFFAHRSGSSTTAVNLYVKDLMLIDSVALTGGGATHAATWSDLAKALSSWGAYELATLQGSNQVMGKFPLAIGDGGSNTTYFDGEGAAFEFPPTFGVAPGESMKWNVDANRAGLTVNAGASDVVMLGAGAAATETQQPLTIASGSSTSATYSFAQAFVGWAPAWKTGIDVASAIFSECGEINFKGTDVTDTTVKKTTSTDAAVAFDASGATMTRCTIDVTGTSAAYHLELGASVTGITLVDVTFSGTPGTDKVHVKATSGTVTLTLSGTTTLASGDVTSDGATVVIDAPAVERGLNFTGLVAGSQVKVFDTGTTTERFSTSSSGTSEEWSETTAGSVTVDYTVMKAGYRPIRVTGITVTAALSGGIIDTPIQQQVDRAYVASSGLTYGSNTSANTGTERFGLTAASTVQNFYSHMIETWIAEAGFKNVQFPITPNGSTSFSFDYGWEWDNSTSIAYLSNDGMRYTDGSVTAQWAAINSVGVPTGVQARYQQTDGSGTTNGENTGNVSQLIQVYGDASHGNFDKRSHMVWKVQAATYDEAEFDVVANYGTLEDQVYVVGLTPTSNGVAGAAITTGVTITDHGASPVTWNSVAFSLTITSDRSGEEILQYIRNANNFNHHDLVRPNGTAYKTVRGAIYGDTGASIKGVRVLNSGGDAHPDFTLFTGDDGSTYAPAVSAAISITGMPTASGAETRLQVINYTASQASAWQATTAYTQGAVVLRTTGVGTENTAGLYMRATTGGTSGGTEPTWDTTVGNTTSDGTVVWTTYAVLYCDADPTTSSYSSTYIDGEEILAGETIKIRFAEMDAGVSFKTYATSLIAASTGFSAAVDTTADSVYAVWAIDGSSYDTTFSPDYVANYLILDTNTDFSGKSAGAYFCYLLTTSQGMYLFWGGMTLIDSGNIRINDSVLSLYFDESAGFVKQTDSVRIFRDDGTRPALDPTTGGAGIEINWRVPVNVVTTGGSAMTSEESAHLLGLTNAPSASSNAAAVLAAAQSTPIHSDPRKFKGLTIGGTGVPPTYDSNGVQTDPGDPFTFS